MNESFTGFVEMSSVSTESISAAILAHLSRIGVDLPKLVGQGYDGASTVAGHVSGVQKHIRKKYPPAIFVHCAAQCLNLLLITRVEFLLLEAPATSSGKLFVSFWKALKSAQV